MCLDTCAVIYHLDDTSRYQEMTQEVFRQAAAGKLELVIPPIVQLELLVGPMRRGRADEVEMVLELTEQYPNARVADMDRRAVLATAAIRAATGLKVPDAMVLATGALERCEAIIGNDGECEKASRSLPELLVPGRGASVRVPEYVLLSDFGESA